MAIVPADNRLRRRYKREAQPGNFGTCFGLPADTYVVQVYVSAAPSGQLGNCKTGYLGQYWALEVEEVY